MMEQPLTIIQLDNTATQWIEREAQRIGVPMEAIVRQLIYRGLEVQRQKARRQRHDELGALAGTWSAEEADEFNNAVAEFSEIESGM